MIFALIVIFTLLGSVLSVACAGLVLLIKPQRISLFTSVMIPYSIGTLLGAAFFGMIPNALSRLGVTSVLRAVLAGFILFYVLEKFALWRHCHERPCHVHSRAGSLILIGDALHNFVDGVAIAVAFTGSIPLGIGTSLAVIAHEIPQEVGDFAILLEGRYSRSRAFWLNTLSGGAALPGAVMTYLLLSVGQSLAPYMISVSAASFIYIALADLVPGRRAAGGPKSLAWELPLIAAGIGTIAVLRFQASL